MRSPSYEDFVDGGKEDAKLPSPLRSDAVASLVYTSGTTGDPKAVELTHESARSVCAMMHARIPLDEETVIVSYLPLSHIAALGIDVYSAVFCGARVGSSRTGTRSRGPSKATLLRARPALFFGVPRVWEKMAASMQRVARDAYAHVTGPVKRAIGAAAKAVGAAWWAPRRRRSPAPRRGPHGALQEGRLRQDPRGVRPRPLRPPLLRRGAPRRGDGGLPQERRHAAPRGLRHERVLRRHRRLGAPRWRAAQGACGRPLPGGAVVVAADGEVLWRGANSMRGYKGLPAATAAALDDDGSLHTGDLGALDGDGFLHIVGRKKDIIITAGGENVAPTPIEDALAALLGATAVLVGDKRKFPRSSSRQRGRRVASAAAGGRGRPQALQRERHQVPGAAGTQGHRPRRQLLRRDERAHADHEAQAPFVVSSSPLVDAARRRRPTVAYSNDPPVGDRPPVKRRPKPPPESSGKSD